MMDPVVLRLAKTPMEMRNTTWSYNQLDDSMDGNGIDVDMDLSCLFE